MDQILTPLVTLFQWQNLMLMLVGTFIGVVVGVLPGIGATQAMALMIPLTWKMDVTPALVLLISIYSTSKFGGSLTAILFNIPGDNPNAVTLIDGYPMAKNGQAKTAIAASASVSIMGGLFSSLSLIIFMPVMYQIILLFGPAEFFMLALFGLTAIAAVSAKTLVKGLMSGGIGILIATIGYHPLVEQGRVLETAAIHVGGRLLVVDQEGKIVRLDPGGACLAKEVGYDWQVGDRITAGNLEELAAWMAQAVLTAALTRPLPPEIARLFLTPPLKDLENIDGIMFSGGVGEYVYGRETRDFGDLGKLLGGEIQTRVANGNFPWPVLPAGECIRATVIGASSYSLQVSGNTIHLSSSSLLPRKNLQVLHPVCDLNGLINAELVARAIRDHLVMFDVKAGETEVALAFRWHGLPSYERVAAFARGIRQGLAEAVQAGKAIFIVLDGDIAQTLGILLREEGEISGEILVIDGIILQDFDFIDLGRMLEPSHTVPVTVKSLIFGQDGQM